MLWTACGVAAQQMPTCEPKHLTKPTAGPAACSPDNKRNACGGKGCGRPSLSPRPRSHQTQFINWIWHHYLPVQSNVASQHAALSLASNT